MKNRIIISLILLSFGCTEEELPQISITSIETNYQVPGSLVNIDGNNFTESMEAVVLFNSTEIELNYVSSTKMAFVVPNIEFEGNIIVESPDLNAQVIFPFTILKDFPRDGLAAFWDFNSDLSSTLTGLNEGTNHGASYTTDRFGNTSKAISFNGQSYLDFGNPDQLQITGNITVSLWLRVSEIIGLPCFISKADENGNGYKFDFGKRGDQSIGYSFFIKPYTGINYMSGNFIPSDNWVHLAFTLNGENAVYYENGNNISDELTGHTPLTVTQGSHFTVGNYNGSYFFTGDIDDIAIYNRALTSEEIQKLYHQNVTSK